MLQITIWYTGTSALRASDCVPDVMLQQLVGSLRSRNQMLRILVLGTTCLTQAWKCSCFALTCPGGTCNGSCFALTHCITDWVPELQIVLRTIPEPILVASALRASQSQTYLPFFNALSFAGLCRQKERSKEKARYITDATHPRMACSDYVLTCIHVRITCSHVCRQPFGLPPSKDAAAHIPLRGTCAGLCPGTRVLLRRTCPGLRIRTHTYTRKESPDMALN